MRISLRGIRGTGEEVTDRLKRAFIIAPEVLIEKSSDAGGTVGVTVEYGSEDTRDLREREDIKKNIDAILTGSGYIFCNVEHRDALETVGGWPTL